MTSHDIPPRPRSSQFPHRYRVFGLVVGSERELPELVATDSAEVDVVVRWAPAHEDILQPVEVGADYTIARDALVFVVPDVAAFAIRRGQEIEVAPAAPGAPVPSADNAVRTYLLGSALGAILHQRGVLPVHASAVSAPGGVWLFCGDSGAGKSTLAAAMVLCGRACHFSDDVVAVVEDHGLLTAHAGPPRVKLWADALAYFGIDRDGLVQDLARMDKFHLPKGFSVAGGPLPLAGVVELAYVDGRPPRLVRLGGAEGLRCVMASVYRPMIARIQADPAEFLRQAAAIAGRVPVYRLTRPRELASIEGSLDVISKAML